MTSDTTVMRHASRSPDYERRRPVFWANGPPVVEAGVLFVTPLDSDELLALERAAAVHEALVQSLGEASGNFASVVAAAELSSAVIAPSAGAPMGRDAGSNLVWDRRVDVSVSYPFATLAERDGALR